MASDKVQHNPTSHTLRVKKSRIKEESQVAKRETRQTLKQLFLGFTIIYGGFDTARLMSS